MRADSLRNGVPMDSEQDETNETNETNETCLPSTEQEEPLEFIDLDEIYKLDKET